MLLTICFLSLLHASISQPSRNDSFSTAALNVSVATKFREQSVAQDLGIVAPDKLLRIYYGTQEVSLGNTLTPSQVTHAPSMLGLSWVTEHGAFYTLAMVDPDAPSRSTPVAREWLHWLVTNIPDCGCVFKGTTLVGYMGATPPPGTGPHRYAVLAFKQRGTFNSTVPNARASFRIADYARVHGLGNPVAGNFFVAQAAN